VTRAVTFERLEYADGRGASLLSCCSVAEIPFNGGLVISQNTHLHNIVFELKNGESFTSKTIHTSSRCERQLQIKIKIKKSRVLFQQRFGTLRERENESQWKGKANRNSEHCRQCAIIPVEANFKQSKEKESSVGPSGSS
jgi:hypothetical protein